MSKANYLETLQKTYTEIAERYIVVRDDMLLIPELEMFIELLGGTCILDAGCGPGRDSRYFQKKSLKVTGIDFTKRFILLAKQRVPGVEFRVMNIIDLKFKEAKFDGIWCCAVLSHLKQADLLKALREFHRTLKSGGVLFVSIKAGIGQRLVQEPLFDNKARFTAFLQKNEVSEYLQEAGFNLVNIHTFNERERFGPKHRDLDYIATFSLKTS